MPERSSQRSQARTGPAGGESAPVTAGEDTAASARGQSREVAAQRPGATAGASVADQMPSAVELRGVAVSFQLAAGKNLSSTWERELRTEHASTITLRVTAESMAVECSPGILIDAMWPVQNMKLWRATWWFDDAQPEVSVSLVRGLGQGMWDASDTAREQIGQLLRAGLAGTPMARPGYDPFQDANVMATVQQVAANLQQTPSSGAPDVGPKDLSRVSAEATLAMKSPFEHASDGGGLRIPAGGVFTVKVNGAGSAADLAGAGSAGAGLKAAQIESLELRSDAVQVVKDGETVAVLNQLRVGRGGAVTVEQFTLAGKAKKASDFETLFRVLAGTVALAAQGVPDRAALEIAARSPDAEAQIVPGVTRQTIEAALTEGVRKLLLEHAHAVPGVDLAEILGVAPAS